MRWGRRGRTAKQWCFANEVSALVPWHECAVFDGLDLPRLQWVSTEWSQWSGLSRRPTVYEFANAFQTIPESADLLGV